MDSQTALELVKNGVTLLFLDVPQYTLVAIDTQMFSVGPAFKGIKMIPPGTHFVYYSSSTRDGKEFSPIIGFFIDVGPSEVVVRKWDQQEERLVKVSEEEEERYSQAVKNLEFDRQLGPYNLSHYEDWKRLSNFITKSVIERLEPIGGEISVECENEMVRNTPKTPMEKALAKLKDGNSATSGGKFQRKGCYYTSIPRVVKCKGISGHELTSLNLDKTQLLETLLAKDYGGSEDLLLGELQFAFIAFLMGQSLEAFLQWKSLVSLLFGCTEAPFHTRTRLFTKFIKVIYYQLKYGLQKDHMDETRPPLLDDSWLSADSFLHHLCKDFFSLVLDVSVVDGDLLKWTRKFKELLESNLGWEFQQSSAVDGMYFEENDEIDGRLYNLKKDVSVQDSKHRKTLAELEKGVDGLFDSFARLDSRISSVGQTAAKIGDHLQSADAQRETASQTIDLIKYLMEFNSSPGDLMELSPLFSDDSRVAEAASIAQKLRSFAEEDIGRHGIGVPSAMGNASASRGLEVAVANLQDYCNELENRLLSRFDAASQKRELTTMAECAKILSQFNRGTSAMQHYVATRPMFIDVEVMNADTRLVLGDQAAQASPSNVARGLSSLYKEITDTVRKEAATITAVFPSPSEVMSILVQRVLEQRVTALLDKLLVKPSLVNLPSMEEGGLLLFLRMLAVAYEKTQELARDLRAVGCGDLDVEGLTESLFSSHKDEYPEYEQASLRQLYKMKMEELRAESQQISDSSGTIGRSKGASVASSQQQISVTVVTEFVRWNEEAISRCNLFSSQPATLATHVKAVFTCLLDQVSQYIADGLERARDGLTEAANLRERFVLGTSVSRRVAAAAASAAEAAAAAGESSFRSFMVAVQRSGSSVAIIQQYFANSISRLLLPVDGAHAASCEEMATAMSSAEAAAYKGLQQCIETVMAEVERLLSAEQKATDYRSPDDGMAPDHRPTNACTRVVAYLSRVLESAFTALEGLNKQAFLSELGNRLHKVLLNHWQKYTFNPSGGLRLKRDITEYGEFLRSFNAPSVDEKFELLGIMANVFIVAPESLSTLFEGTPSIRKDAQRFIQLREDYKSAKLASKLSSLWS